MRWVRLKNGSRELRSGERGNECTHAVIEPARTRGHYWWTTWGMRIPDLAGYAFSFADAKQRLADLGLEAR